MYDDAFSGDESKSWYSGDGGNDASRPNLNLDTGANNDVKPIDDVFPYYDSRYVEEASEALYNEMIKDESSEVKNNQVEDVSEELEDYFSGFTSDFIYDAEDDQPRPDANPLPSLDEHVREKEVDASEEVANENHLPSSISPFSHSPTFSSFSLSSSLSAISNISHPKIDMNVADNRPNVDDDWNSASMLSPEGETPDRRTTNATGTQLPYDTRAVFTENQTGSSPIVVGKATSFSMIIIYAVVGAAAACMVIVVIAVCRWRHRDTIYNVNKEEKRHEEQTTGRHLIINSNGSVIREHNNRPKADPNKEVYV